MLVIESLNDWVGVNMFQSDIATREGLLVDRWLGHGDLELKSEVGMVCYVDKVDVDDAVTIGNMVATAISSRAITRAACAGATSTARQIGNPRNHLTSADPIQVPTFSLVCPLSILGLRGGDGGKYLYTRRPVSDHDCGFMVPLQSRITMTGKRSVSACGRD